MEGNARRSLLQLKRGQQMSLNATERVLLELRVVQDLLHTLHLFVGSA